MSGFISRTIEMDGYAMSAPEPLAKLIWLVTSLPVVVAPPQAYPWFCSLPR
jgi:hypothetical protein